MVWILFGLYWLLVELLGCYVGLVGLVFVYLLVVNLALIVVCDVWVCRLSLFCGLV